MQNFGKIKNVFNDILSEGIVSNNSLNKELFKKYVKTINESEILRTKFLVYYNLENAIEKDNFSADKFIRENIKCLEKFSKSDIIKENKKLLSLIPKKEIKSSDDKLTKIHEAISNLIFTNSTPTNVKTITENYNVIINYLKEDKVTEKAEAIELPTSLLSNMMVDKYNERYNTLDESEKKVLKSLIDSTDEQKKEIYSEILNECLGLVNDKLKESDLNTKEKLLLVKEKLLNDTKEVNENYAKSISKLIELRESLK